ncbi:MAG: choice-of-anchor Q domain-containing protein [Pirellulaceae bacterium]
MTRVPAIAWISLLLTFHGQTLADDFFVAQGDIAGLIAAVEAANSNDEEDNIVLGAGVFNVLGSDANGQEFLRITSPINLKGDSEELTVIQRLNSEIPFIFFVVEETAAFTMSELMIKGGGGRNGCGGAMIVLPGGQLVIQNSSFIQNYTRFAGGAICNLGGQVVIENSVFKDNQANNGGGAVDNSQSGALTISDSVFVRNSAGRGGAVYNDKSHMTVTHSDFLQNTSTGAGGAIGVDHSGTPADNLLNIVNSTIDGNSARISGGGLDLHSSTTTIVGTTISHNVTELRGGGGIYSGFGHQNIVNTTISNNHAGTVGGGIETAGGAGDGGVTLNNVTLTANSAESEGGGIYNHSSKHVGIQNSILAGNLDSTGVSDCAGSLVSHGYNLVQAKPPKCTFGSVNDIVGVSPQLSPLSDNGGATRTHALLSSSPAIDAGNPSQPGSGGQSCEATDQRGAPRNCDIGAYEYGSDPLVEPFRINTGLNDAWYEPATTGQGILVSVFSASSTMFLAWFTYDTHRPPENAEAQLGEPGHRWLTAQGPYAGDTATLDVYLTAGGVFNKAEPRAATGEEPIGTIILTWQNCMQAILSYDLEQPRVTGKIQLERITADNGQLCQSLVGH